MKIAAKEEMSKEHATESFIQKDLTNMIKEI